MNFVKYLKFQKEDLGFQKTDNTSFIIFYSEIKNDKIDPKWLKGLLDGKVIRDEIDRISNQAYFEYDLRIPFKAVATDLLTGEKIVIDKGKISNAIAAFMSRPGTCIPSKFENRMLVDGGLIDPVPADIAREMGADIVIGVNLSDIKVDTPPVTNNLISIIYRSVYIMLEELNRISSNKADIVIEPQYRGNTRFNMEQEERLKLIRLGEEETKKIIPLLKSLIESYQ